MVSCGERFADVNVVTRMLHGGSGVIVWAGISYGQRTQLHLIDGNLNGQRCCNEILRPIVMIFQRCHHLSTIIHGPMSQESVHNSCKLKKSQLLLGLHTHQTCHPLTMLGYSGSTWMTAFQFPPISSNFAQPLKRSETIIHRPQSTAWSTLYEGDVSRCMSANGGHTRYWLAFWSTPLPFF